MASAQASSWVQHTSWSLAGLLAAGGACLVWLQLPAAGSARLSCGCCRGCGRTVFAQICPGQGCLPGELQHFTKSSPAMRFNMS